MAFKKALMTCAAVGALSVALAASAFAADTLTVVQDKTDDVENGKVSITAGLNGASGQMTVLIFEQGADTDDDGLTASEILYIDQIPASDLTEVTVTADDGTETTVLQWQSMGIRSSALDEDGKLDVGTYTVLVGSDATGAAILSGTLTVGGNVMLGDVDGSTKVNELDAAAIMDYCVELLTLTETQLKAGDVDGSTKVNVLDAADIMDYCVELPSYIAGTK